MAIVKTKVQSQFSYSVAFYGRVRSARRTPVGFEIPGQITEVLVDEGEVIAAGEPVARLNTTILEAERERLIASKAVEQAILRRLRTGEREEVIAAADAMVSKVGAELAQATRDRDRLKALRERRVTTESDYDAAWFKAKSLEASLEAAKARLVELTSGTREEDIEAQQNRLLELDTQVAVLDARIGKAVVNAPFTAHVVQRMADEGAVVQAGQPVLLLHEADRFEACFSVPISQLDTAKTAAAVQVAGIDVPIECARTISSVSTATRTIDVVFTLRPRTPVMDGQTCTVILEQAVHARGVEIPLSALVPSVRGLWSVYRLEKHQSPGIFRVVREDVAVNHSDGGCVYIETSMPDGALVVRTGVHRLVPGILVRVRDGDL